MTAPADTSLPHSPEAEIAVLGALLQEDRALQEATARLSPGDFYRDSHRRIFAAALALSSRNEPVELASMTGELRRRGDLELLGGPAALHGFLEAVPSPANVGYYAGVVRDHARRRRLIETCLRVAEGATTNGSAEALDRLVGELEAEVFAAQQDDRPREDASIGVGEFLTPPPELVWDVEGVRLQGDHGWTGGAPKGMKGLTSLEEARACATGTPFLGQFRTRKTTVLYVSEEDRPARLHRRIHAMLTGRPPEEIPGPDDLRFLVKAGVRLDSSEGLAVLRWHLERWRPEIVFLEHFDKLHAKDSNKAADVKPLLDELDNLHTSFGCTFRIQKHNRKEAAGQSKRAGEMLAGSVALFGWGESSIHLTLIRKGVAQVEVEAKDGDTAPRFLVEYQAGRIVYGGEVQVNKKEQARERVLEFLDRKPGASREEVAAELGVTVRTAQTRLSELERAGMVEGRQVSRREPKAWFKSAKDKAEVVGK